MELSPNRISYFLPPVQAGKVGSLDGSGEADHLQVQIEHVSSGNTVSTHCHARESSRKVLKFDEDLVLDLRGHADHLQEALPEDDEEASETIVVKLLEQYHCPESMMTADEQKRVKTYRRAGRCVGVCVCGCLREHASMPRFLSGD